MWRILQVVGSVGLLSQPDSLISRVVEDNVTDAEHTPVLPEAGEEALHLGESG